MIIVYGFGAGMGVLDPIPYVLKVIAYLKVLDVPFEYIGNADNLQKAPRGKLPFIDDSGEIIADSLNILLYIEKNISSQWMSI